MAIDKRNAPPWVKATIVVIAMLLVIAFGGALIPGLAALFSSDQSAGAQAGRGTLDAVAAEKGPQIMAIEQALASDPTSYTVLVALGNSYFDYALAVQEVDADPIITSALWSKAADGYQRALAIDPADPNVATDLSIALYYGGSTDDAIVVVESVLAQDPKFAAALYNAGVFYRTAGRTADAIRVLEAFLVEDPDGRAGNRQLAEQFLGELKSQAGGGGAAPGTVSPGTAP